jgi:hypothetical protein
MNEIRNNTAAGILVAGYCTAVSLSPLPECADEPPIIGEASANNNLISDNVLIGNAENTPSFLPPGDILYLQLDPSPEYPEVGDLNCFERNENPVQFTFFSSQADGELPTGGCVAPYPTPYPTDPPSPDAGRPDDGPDDGPSPRPIPAPPTPATPNPQTDYPVFSPSSGGKLLAILLYHYSYNASHTHDSNKFVQLHLAAKRTRAERRGEPSKCCPRAQ